MSQLTACLFDLDGVLVDTAKYHFLAWRRLANSLGFDFSESDNEKLKGVSRKESLDLILSWGNVTRSEAEKTQLATLKNDWYCEYIEEMTPSEILEGVLPFLEELRNMDIKIALGSASKNAMTILKKVAIADMFDAVIDGNHVTHSKPHPEVFLKGAAALQVSPSSCVVFEDASKGIDAALSANMFAVGIGTAAALPHAHLVISSFKNQSPKHIFAALLKKNLPSL